MSVDAPDWNQQVSVNVSSVGQIPVEIKTQTLSRVLVTPDNLWDKYEREKISKTATAVAATTEVSLGTYSGVGVGFSLRVKVDYPELKFRLRVDGAQISTQDIENVWTTWGGGYFEDMRESRVIVYDAVNDIYVYARDYGWVYPFTTSCELRVYNPDAAQHNVANAIMAFLIPI